MFQSSHSSPTPSPRAQWDLYNFGYANFERGAPLAPACNGKTSVGRGPMVVPSMVVGCHMPPTNILRPRRSSPWLYGKLDFEFKPGYRACLIQTGHKLSLNLILGPDLVSKTDVFVNSVASAAGCSPGSGAAEAQVLRGQVSVLDGTFSSCEIILWRSTGKQRRRPRLELL